MEPKEKVAAFREVDVVSVVARNDFVYKNWRDSVRMTARWPTVDKFLERGRDKDDHYWFWSELAASTNM